MAREFKNFNSKPWVQDNIYGYAMARQITICKGRYQVIVLLPSYLPF